MKKLYLLMLVGLSFTLVACGRTEKQTHEPTTHSETKIVKPVTYLDSLLAAFEAQGIAFKIIDPTSLDENLPDRELYQVAEKIYEFDLQPETGIQDDILPPSNEMRTGKIIVFPDEGSMTNLVTTLSEQFYFDYLGVDTNYVNPVFISNKEQLTLLQLNQFLPETLIKKYELLFQ